MKKSLLLVATLIVIVSASYAQTSKFIGLSANIQGNQYGISVPLRFSESFALVPSVDLAYVQDNSTDLITGLAGRFYLRNAKLSPYLALRAGVAINMPADDFENSLSEPLKNKIDLLGGIGFGGEFFLDEHFSFGVEAQGNFSKSDNNSFRFGNPDKLIFNTATMVSATIYF